MGIQAPTEQLQKGPEETKKRRREVVTVLSLGFLFAALTWVEVGLFSLSGKLPFIHSIFFFGLVNFNIVIVLLLLFLVFRNLVKVFVERKGGFFGSSIRAKLVAAFVAFSTIPTLLMFIISVFYINSSFEKWFSLKVSAVLKSSLDVTNAYYGTAKRRNYHFADKIAQQISRTPLNAKGLLRKARDEYSLDLVEYYPSLFADRVVVGTKSQDLPVAPPVSLDFLKKGIVRGLEASTIHHFAGGNLVRAIVPVRGQGSIQGAVVVSTYVPLSLLARMNDVASAYQEFRDINPLEYPLKSIYMILLILMTLVILVCATWFGFYLAKHLAIPLFELGEASRAVARGDYPKIEMESGSEEINDLIVSFNQMTTDLSRSRREVEAANESLRLTLERLDEHTRYIEVVLSNVSTGVISLDSHDRITTMNRRAGELLKLDPDHYLGYSVQDVLNQQQYGVLQDLLRTMRGVKATSVQKEVHFDIGKQMLPLQMHLSILRDDEGVEVGKVLVFDDLSPLVSAQRAAAWTDVARRIAHEIKNPLTPIKLSAQRLQKKFGAQIVDPAFLSSTQMIIQQVDDLKTLVNEFNSFARLPECRPTVSDLNAVCGEVVDFFQTAHSNVGFQFKSDPRLRPFLFDKDQMRRVLNNLLDNAVAAVEGIREGQIVVETNYDALLGMVRLMVRDNGVGMSQKDRLQVFEPYFSTKKNGTGLGLAIVRRVIEDHNGFVRARENLPSGTEMLVELPFLETQVSMRVTVRSEHQPHAVEMRGIDEK